MCVYTKPDHLTIIIVVRVLKKKSPRKIEMWEKRIYVDSISIVEQVINICFKKLRVEGYGI